MLVLRRKAGEAIVLNGVITIYVLAVEGERVKLGISAPPEVVIVRSELLDPPTGAPTGPGGGPMGQHPGPGPMDSGSSFVRPPHPPHGTERPYREPEPPTRPGGPPAPPTTGAGGYSSPARYTPRRRFDNYGEDVGAPSTGPLDPYRSR
ncbi:MAG TPA: carbon storage regulator [Ktedonobacterales bacterium]